MDMSALQNAIPAGQLAPILVNLTAVREAIFTADAWRSLVVILIGVALLYAYTLGKLKANLTIGLLALLCLVDMWGVNKRYLYDAQFVSRGTEMQPFAKPSETDRIILEDKALDYRVLNLASNTFNENNTSYWHKSIGGYHAAKLRRYQELIEEHIQGEMTAVFKEVSAAGGNMDSIDATRLPVLNLLNTRYFIFPLQDGKTLPLYNPHALGNAWFVREVLPVSLPSSTNASPPWWGKRPLQTAWRW